MGHDAVHANNSQKYGNSAKNSKKREVDPVPQRLIRRIVFHGPNVIHRKCAIDFSNDRPHCWNDLCSAGIGTNDKIDDPVPLALLVERQLRVGYIHLRPLYLLPNSLLNISNDAHNLAGRVLEETNVNSFSEGVLIRPIVFGQRAADHRHWRAGYLILSIELSAANERNSEGVEILRPDCIPLRSKRFTFRGRRGAIVNRKSVFAKESDQRWGYRRCCGLDSGNLR